MPVTLHSPSGLLQPAPYHHVAVGTGGRQIFIAGQVGHRADGDIASDLVGQIVDALRNVTIALAGVAASPTDLVRLTFYVTNWTPDKIESLMEGIAAATDELGLPTPLPPASLIGVDQLFEPELLVEIEATAVTG